MAKKTIEIKLDEPVTINGKTHDTVKLESFKTKHFKSIPDMFFEYSGQMDGMSDVERTRLGIQMIPLICAMSDNPDVVNELEVIDLFKVLDAFAPFFEESFSAIDGKE